MSKKILLSLAVIAILLIGGFVVMTKQARMSTPPRVGPGVGSGTDVYKAECIPSVVAFWTGSPFEKDYQCQRACQRQGGIDCYCYDAQIEEETEPGHFRAMCSCVLGPGSMPEK